MKRKILPILEITFFSLLVTISGCKKFLDIDPPYTQDAENFFTNESDYERALIGAYDLLQGTFLSVWISEIASDNTIAGGESVTDTEGLHQIDAMNHGAVNNELRNIFRWNYAGITRCNFITENKDNIDFDGKNIIIAQARFLRAFYYFELVKFFGDVPLIIDQRLGVEQVTELPRSPKVDVYAQIESDLTYAVDNLELTTTTKGKATKGAAQSLLGKAYLYQQKWIEAAQMFDLVINSGQYGLFNDFSKLFLVDNEGCNETIFDVEYSGLEGGGYGCLICLEGNAGPGFQGIRQYNGPVYGDGNSYNLPTQNLYDAFEANDLRREATCLDIDAFIAAQPNAASITYAEGGGGHTGYYNNKYIKRQAEIGLPDNDLTSPVNYRAIRYADVLLMAAEAYFESGNPSLATQYLNSVRARVNMPSISGITINEIYNERRLELSCEGHRFFDLVRTGQATSMITNFTTNKNELFPIPLVEIDLAGGNWTQNQGY